MKVYVVKVLWRNKEGFNSYFTLHKTLKKAKAQFEKEIDDICVDYAITRDDMEFGELWAEFNSHGYDYAYVEISLEEVK